MIHSIKDLSDKQIEELRQCPGVIITLDKHIAEVPMMAEGLFLSISKNVISILPTEAESKTCNVITETEVPPTVEKLCKCGEPATTYDFGEIENKKIDWRFYCNSCNPHAIDCSECSNRAIPYVDPSGKTIFDKCNVHGARLKVTHADIDAMLKKKNM